MTPMCGSDGNQEWTEWVAGMSSDQLEEDELQSLFEASKNLECVPSNMPSEHNLKILETLPEITPAMTSWSVGQRGQPSCNISPLVYFSDDSRLLACKDIDGFRLLSDINGLPPSIPDHFKEGSVAGDPLRANLGIRTHGVVHFKDRPVTRAKRLRSPDWSAEEKQVYLELKVEAIGTVVGKPDWDFISKGLLERHNFVRSSKCCEDLWGTLRKAYFAIREHESSKSAPQTNNCVSYWEMDEDGRLRKKLPRSFSLEWYTMMERIFNAQKRRFGKKSRQILVEVESLRDEDGDNYTYRHPPGDPFGGGSSQHTEGEGTRIMSHPGGARNLKYTRRKRVNDITTEDDQNTWISPRIKQHVEDGVNSAIERLACRRRSHASSEGDDLIATLSPLVKQQVEDAVNSALQPLASRKRCSVTIDENDIMTSLAPYFKTVEEALSSALQPVASALQALELEEQEYEEKLQALAEKRRALDREENQIKRQRVGRHQRPPRASLKQQGPRTKTTITEGVIPALKGLNIAGDED